MDEERLAMPLRISLESLMFVCMSRQRRGIGMDLCVCASVLVAVHLTAGEFRVQSDDRAVRVLQPVTIALYMRQSHRPVHA